MSSELDEIVFKPNHYNHYVWCQPSVDPNRKYYSEYVLKYVDFLLAISKYPNKTMGKINNTYKFKKDTVDDQVNLPGFKNT